MFLGHLALGYAAKRWVPHVSLAVLLAATQVADLIWPVLVAAGVEQVRIAPGITAFTPLEFVSYPYSHSLATLAVWGVLFAWLFAPAFAALPLRRGGLTSAASPTAPSAPNAPIAPGAPNAPTAPSAPLVLFVLVVSHWVLDFVTHIPDMPLYPGSAKFGLGLWNSVAATRFVEITMFTIGLSIYLTATRPRDRTGRWATWGLAVFLLVGYLASGPPPPSVTALWMMALSLFGMIMALAYWSDRHRVHGR
jgi:hypothetical protein